MFGQLIINEVLYDPSNNALDGDANGDGVYDQENDSFIEFYNTASTNFDASGYQIYDDTVNGQLRYVIPAGTLVPPHGALVVFGGGTLVGSFGNAVVLKTDSAVGMNLNNSGEVIAIKNSNGQTVLTFDSDALSNNPNESYTRNPDITGQFEQHGDNTPLLFSPGTKIDGTPFDTVFVVSTITVQGQGGVSSINTPSGTLQMEAAIYPSYAGDTTVTWSVSGGGAVATISSTGLLTAVSDGSVMVKATANDGTGVMDSTQITITNQTIGLAEVDAQGIKLFPNPVNNELSLVANQKIDKIEIYNVSGQQIKSFSRAGSKVDVSKLSKGVYILRAFSDNQWIKLPFIKQ